MKIVVLDGFLANHDRLDWDIDRECDVTWFDRTRIDEIIERIGDAPVVMVNRLNIGAEVFNACKDTLKLILVLGTGYNMIDLEAARNAGVTICNAPGYSTDAVAQTTFSLLLDIATRISVYAPMVKAKKWNSPADKNVTAISLMELSGKTIGIIGMGSIGTAVAKIANAFGMKVLAYRRNPDKSLENDMLKFVTLDELAQYSDIISIHCPLNEQTIGMINSQFISKMKDNSIIINTSRGAVLNEQDVADALDSGKLYMVGVDVLSSEPPMEDNPIAFHNKVVVTPHIAWAPKETRQRLLCICADNLHAFLDGNPINVVGK